MFRGPWIFNFTQSINYYVVWPNAELRERSLWSEKSEINCFWKTQSIWRRGAASDWVVTILQLLYNARGVFTQGGTSNPNCKLQLNGHALAALIKSILSSTQWEWENNGFSHKQLIWTGPFSLSVFSAGQHKTEHHRHSLSELSPSVQPWGACISQWPASRENPPW